MTTEDVLREYYAAYNAGDADRLAGLLDDDVVLHAGGSTQQGRDAYLDMYRYMTSTFKDRINPSSISGDGENGTTEFENVLVARQDVADFMGKPVSAGETVRFTMTGRYVVREGKIVEIHLG